jgi:hypothetical protein
MPRALKLEVQSGGQRQEIPTGFEQAIPGTMVMFTMIVLLTSGAATLVAERRLGVLRRLAATPISRNRSCWANGAAGWAWAWYRSPSQWRPGPSCSA